MTGDRNAQTGSADACNASTNAQSRPVWSIPAEAPEVVTAKEAGTSQRASEVTAGDLCQEPSLSRLLSPGDTSATQEERFPQRSPIGATADGAEDLPVVLLADTETKLTWWQRAVLIMIALGVVAVLWIARELNPYDENGQPRRWGTHQQLGLPPCSFQRLTGWPCPSCGLTTSFSLLMWGDWRAALAVNPAGPGLALLAVTFAVWFLLAAITGQSLGLPDWDWLGTVAAWSILSLVLGCWFARLVIYLRTGVQ